MEEMKSLQVEAEQKSMSLAYSMIKKMQLAVLLPAILTEKFGYEFIFIWGVAAYFLIKYTRRILDIGNPISMKKKRVVFLKIIWTYIVVSFILDFFRISWAYTLLGSLIVSYIFEVKMGIKKKV